jgi:hypothetical protein
VNTLDCQRRQTKRGFNKDVFALMIFSSLDRQDFSEECLSAISQEHFFELAKSVLAVITNEILKANIILEVA